MPIKNSNDKLGNRSRDLSAGSAVPQPTERTRAACLISVMPNYSVNANFGVMFYIYTHIFLWRCEPTRARVFSFLKFLDHTYRCTTVGRTPLNE
jgi:hypothetical protein